MKNILIIQGPKLLAEIEAQKETKIYKEDQIVKFDGKETEFKFPLYFENCNKNTKCIIFNNILEIPYFIENILPFSTGNILIANDDDVFEIKIEKFIIIADYSFFFSLKKLNAASINRRIEIKEIITSNHSLYFTISHLNNEIDRATLHLKSIDDTKLFSKNEQDDLREIYEHHLALLNEKLQDYTNEIEVISRLVN